MVTSIQDENGLPRNTNIELKDGKNYVAKTSNTTKLDLGQASLRGQDEHRLKNYTRRNEKFDFSISLDSGSVQARFPVFFGTDEDSFLRHRELSLKIRRLKQDPNYFSTQNQGEAIGNSNLSWSALVEKNVKPMIVPKVKKPSVIADNSLKPLGYVLLRIMVDDLFKTPIMKPITTRGIVNTGNICYMNSVLQILVHCDPVVRIMEVITKGVRANFAADSKSPLLDAFTMLIEQFTIPYSTKAVSPATFFNAVARLPRFAHLRWGRQEDAEEFLGYLLDGLHEEFVGAIKDLSETERQSLLQKIDDPERKIFILNSLEAIDGNSGSSAGSSTTSTQALSRETDDGWQEVGNDKKFAAKRTVQVKSSPITQLFGGQFRSVLDIPRQRESKSITLDPFMHVQLDISDPKINTLEEAFLNLSAAEEIPYKSQQGKDVTAIKQTFIHKLPKVLIIHLKRFEYVPEDSFSFGRIEKLKKKIEYGFDLEIPLESISDSRKRLSSKPLHRSYKLIGVVYHHGAGAEGGHYTVDVLKSEKNKWLRIDDAAISELSKEEVTENSTCEDAKSAYILTYQRLD
ncbi:unnamed protein product [Kuraishia capsulata CBS 1993]|uniref:Ubiquitin carboxyl-terminal hydrolase n=1 Tax=Kuraishia capsulata CBS 1993 TaxID=1382522 RepID=W6MKA5_9ASCO|nr:uncharacterized protein KUCA_T00002936001 [Kuraishia capsulata CBS 1993]CDK26959.1 unnamed protein product [Kuraishia capsulata CBS 1993]